LTTLQARSCLRPVHYSFAHHPQIRQQKNHQQLAGVLGQAPVTRLAVPELTLDDPKRVLYLGPEAGLELLQLVTQRVAEFGFGQRFALTEDYHIKSTLHNPALHLIVMPHAVSLSPAQWHALARGLPWSRIEQAIFNLSWLHFLQ
jgi:hypothetical protein